ncbi:hypothetical protein GGI23_006217 [Coemansia sp. RSA 2559]|nr:hypothetical protein GGI23_006217 [Coemansia sp. RSA 2559]
MCQFSISYNGEDFAVIDQVVEDCFKQGDTSYTLELPDTLPASDSAVFAWTWLSPVDRGDFYMNCADIEIVNDNGSKSYSSVAMSVFNYPDYPEIYGKNNINGPELLYYMEDEQIVVGPGMARAYMKRDTASASAGDKCDNPSSVYGDSSSVGDYSPSGFGEDNSSSSESKSHKKGSHSSTTSDSSTEDGSHSWNSDGPSYLGDSGSSDSSYYDDGKCDESYTDDTSSTLDDSSSADNSSSEESSSELGGLESASSSDGPSDISGHMGSSTDSGPESPTSSAEPTSSEEPTSSSSTYLAGPIVNSNEPVLQCTTSASSDVMSDIYYSGIYASDEFGYMSMYSDLLTLDSSYQSVVYVTVTDSSDNLLGAIDSSSDEESSSSSDQGDFGMDESGSLYVMFEYSSPEDNGSIGDPVASDLLFNENDYNESPTSSPPPVPSFDTQSVSSAADPVAQQDLSSQNADGNSLFIGSGIQ